MPLGSPCLTAGGRQRPFSSTRIQLRTLGFLSAVWESPLSVDLDFQLEYTIIYPYTYL
jgi:hypothetical protein